jgi:hypothetical protein
MSIHLHSKHVQRNLPLLYSYATKKKGIYYLVSKFLTLSLPIPKSCAIIQSNLNQPLKVSNILIRSFHSISTIMYIKRKFRVYNAHFSLSTKPLLFNIYLAFNQNYTNFITYLLVLMSILCGFIYIYFH